VFVNLWECEIGRPLSYKAVEKLIERTRNRGLSAVEFGHGLGGWRR
jgi:hypothetical protein